MYEVKFHTNLDCPRGTWSFPKRVMSIPQIGHKVRASNGIVLKVCAITHSWREASTIMGVEAGAVLEIELTRRT